MSILNIDEISDSIDNLNIYIKKNMILHENFDEIFYKVKKEFIFDNYISNNIDLFYNKNNGKENNDINNKKREKILIYLSLIKKEDNFIFKNEKWTDLYNKFNTIISSLCENDYDEYTLINKGGRRHNYDFEIIYYKDKKIVYKINELEFKNGNFKTIPQHLSLQVNSKYGNFIKEKYDEYFYKYYIKNLLNIYKKFNSDIPNIPNIEIYKKNVKSVNYNSDKLFIFLKQYESIVKIEKSLLVDESIHEYIKDIKKQSINFKLIQEKIEKSQSKKNYLCWNNNNFNINIIDKNDIVLNNNYAFGYNKNKKINKLILYTKNKKSSWELLLRWRNRKGILNPAWQIKLVKI